MVSCSFFVRLTLCSLVNGPEQNTKVFHVLTTGREANKGFLAVHFIRLSDCQQCVSEPDLIRHKSFRYTERRLCNVDVDVTENNTCIVFSVKYDTAFHGH